MHAPEHTRQKIALHGQLADLGVQLGGARSPLGVPLALSEDLGSALEQLALPPRDLVGVEIEALGDGDHRLLLPQRLEGDLGLEGR